MIAKNFTNNFIRLKVFYKKNHISFSILDKFKSQSVCCNCYSLNFNCNKLPLQDQDKFFKYNKFAYAESNQTSSTKNFNTDKSQKASDDMEIDSIKNIFKKRLIETIKERFNIMGSNSSLVNFFDINSSLDIILSYKNTKHLKIYGTNNLFFNNCKYVLLEKDEKLNMDLLLFDEVYMSKSESFDLFMKVLDDLDLITFYSEKDIIKYIEYNYNKKYSVKDAIDFFANSKGNITPKKSK